MRSIFRGSIVALVTPFADNGAVDFDAIKALVEWHIASGTDGILPCGTTGESPTLSHDEHDRVVEEVVKAVDGRVPVLAGAGSNSTSEALRLVKHAHECGANGALVITPYYNKPTQDGLVAHFETVAASTSLPIIIYNVPGRTGVDIAPTTVARLAQVDNITGIKEANPLVDHASEILMRCTIDLLSGNDSLTLPLMAIGGCGVISVVANIVPDRMSALTKAVFKGDLPKAEQLHRELCPLCRAAFLETNPMPVKAALAAMGRIKENLRLPLVRMSALPRAELMDVLRDMGVL